MTGLEPDLTDSTPYLRPDVKAFLDAMSAMGSPSIADMTLEEARGSYIAMHQMGDRPPRDLAVIRDLSCSGPAGDIALRLYDARESRGEGPVIVFFHGGGYVIGDLDTHQSLCTEIAAQMDLPVVAVDYRRAPEHPFPAAVDDCEAAARWVAGSPAELGRAASGLVLMGDSAGGNATIVTAQAMAAKPGASPVLLQVPLFPQASDETKCQSFSDFAEGYLLTRVAIEFFRSSYAGQPDNPRTFPILGDLAATPPTILATASLDPIRDSGREYAAALVKAGADVTYMEMQGITHSFSNMRQVMPSAQQDIERVFAAMKLALRTGA